MWFSGSRLTASLLLAAVTVAPRAAAEQLIESTSLNPCQANSGISASLFNVLYTPGNASVSFNVNGVSTITGNISAEVLLIAYGLTVLTKTVDPCTLNLTGICPLTAGPITIMASKTVPADIAAKIPSIAYNIPDLDGKVQVYIKDKISGATLACVEADLSNGQTVYQKGVGWATAVIAGLALLTSAVVSGLGHSNTAAHVAANALSLFGYFQTMALFGMTAVQLPPIVASWTQNFQWSMGIIHINFLQIIATWYQRSTGGTPSTTLTTLGTTSVEVEKRSIDTMSNVLARGASYLGPRTNGATKNAQTLSTIIVRGIARVGFRANIERTNIFFTGYVFFFVFVTTVIGLVALFKWILDLLAKAGKIKGDKFQDFRNGWLTVLKGILFRIVLVGFPQMVVLCFWQFTERDSAAELALAGITIITMLVMLGFACLKVVRLARRSIDMHKNPAYILYSDPVSLNKWGFLYVQFKATAYWFVIPALGFILVEGLLVGLGQGSGTAQAVGILIISAAFLVAISILRPYMDKKTNAFNIAIASVNFVSAIFFLFFTNVFGLPGLVVGIMGIAYFVMNAAFALILLIMVLVASAYAVFSKNPDSRYQPMRDDRGSFIKSQTNLTTELDALGATARGEGKNPYPARNLDDDDDSFSSDSIERAKAGYNNGPSPPVYPHSPSQQHLFPGSASPYRSPSQEAFPSYVRSPRNERAEPFRSDPARNRAQNNASPWQRGAGYDR